MGRGKVVVKVDVRALRAMRRHAPQVLQELDGPCRDEVRRTLGAANSLVPRGNPNDDSNLAGTAFIEGPIYNLQEPLSTTWLCGFNHEQAGAIHEGFHWGVQTEVPPPHWMRKSFRGARGRARKAVAKSLMESLRRFLPGR